MASNSAKTHAIRNRKRNKNKANMKATQKRMQSNSEVLAKLSAEKKSWGLYQQAEITLVSIKAPHPAKQFYRLF